MSYGQKEKFGYVLVSGDGVPIKVFWKEKNAIVVINNFIEDENGTFAEVEYQGGIPVERKELEAFVAYVIENN